MSHPSTFGFTRKQLKMIEVIVLLNAMALSILLPTAQSTGEIPGTHDTTTLGTWYNVPTSCVNHDNCELFGNGVNITNDNWGLRQFFSVGNNTYLGSTFTNLVGYSAHLNLDCIGHFGTGFPDPKLNFTLEYSIYGDYNGPASVNPTYSSNLTGWTKLESLPVDADPSGNRPSQGCVYNPLPELTSLWTETGSDLPLNTTAITTNTGQTFNCSQVTVASCGYVFRVILCCASQTGENIEFGSISVTILQNIRREFNSFTSSSTTALSYALTTDFPFQSTTGVTFLWFSTNVSASGRCGISATNTFHCWESGNSSCSFLASNFVCPASGTTSITFGTAFTGTVRTQIQTTRLNLADILVRPITTLTIFTAQPVPAV